LAATLALAGVGPARAANTDVYLDWGIPADPGWYWLHYLDYANHGSNNTIGDTMQVEYQTRTGLTGTARDSFEFWGGAAFGIASTGGAPHSSAAGIAAPEIGAQWYYDIMQPEGKQGDPGYRILVVSPWVQVNAPNGNTNAGGYGAGADQWSVTEALLATYRFGGFTTTLQPITLTEAAANRNTTLVANAAGTPALIRQRTGVSGSFGVFNVGYDVSPTLTLGVYQSWNAYSFAGARDSPRQAEGTVGPTFEYSGLSDSLGLSIDGTVQVDYYHTSNLPQGYFISLYFQKKF
jgi:hypothetical protein